MAAPSGGGGGAGRGAGAVLRSVRMHAVDAVIRIADPGIGHQNYVQNVYLKHIETVVSNVF